MTIRKLIAMLLCVLTVSSLFCALAEDQADKGVIDLYLIGGQSNAAGCSSAGDLSGRFDHVWYAGEVEKNRRTGKAAASTFQQGTYLKAVTRGLGLTRWHIGPEYGMAQVLNDLYTSEQPAMIFKSAAGGTSLRNLQSGNSKLFGNWYPRSMWNKPEIDPASSAMGVQYYNFVENFRWLYERLKADGYTPRVRGMVWMQGEEDLFAPAIYAQLLPTFINDIRADIAAITGDDADLEMPFVIGKIATTFGMYNNRNVPVFNTVQEEVAASMVNVYTIETADLIIVGENGVLGTDQYHFSAADEVTLGVRFAEKLLEHYEAK